MTDQRVLVVAAHPDDEVLGCGGTVAAHVASGDEVHVIIAAQGATSRGEDPAPLAEVARDVAELLEVRSLAMLDLPDNRLDSLCLLDIVQLIEPVIEDLKPAVVYTHHAGDVNIDHALLHQAVVTACRPQPGLGISTVLAFETPSSTEWRPPSSGRSFEPNWFVDISGHLPLKLEALRRYDREMREAPHPRSVKMVESLARWRGATVGVNAAEAFVCLRNIVEPRLPR